MTGQGRKIKHAIILAGGQGSRMLPANLYAPKEILPLIDTPILNHLIWEAQKGGVEKIHIVFSTKKRDMLNELFIDEVSPVEIGIRPDLPPEALLTSPHDVEILIHEQKKPGGVGDAIKVAIGHIDGPFLVLLGDNLLMDNHPSPRESGIKFASNGCQKLVDYFEETGLPCAGIIRVEANELSKYGVVKYAKNLIEGIVEKPDLGKAPSNYILCGRYLLTSDTSDILDIYSKEEYGELQSIALFNHYIRNGGFGCVKFDGFSLYDSGAPLSWLKAQIDHSLKREDLKKEMYDWIVNRIHLY